MHCFYYQLRTFNGLVGLYVHNLYFLETHNFIKNILKKNNFKGFFMENFYNKTFFKSLFSKYQFSDCLLSFAFRKIFSKEI